MSTPAPEPQPSIWHRLDRILARLRPHREPLALCVDGLVVVVAWQVTYLFRLGFERWVSARPAYDAWVLLGIVATYIAVFALLRIPRGIWRFVGFGDIQRLALASLLSGLLVAVMVSGVLQLQKVPRAVLALHPFVVLLGVCGVRLFYRMLYEHARNRMHRAIEPIRTALVLGAGQAARRLIAGIHGQGWQVVALLDDDPQRQGRTLDRIPILGPLSAVQRIARERSATHLILAIPSMPPARRRHIIDLAAQSGLPLLTVPSAHELMQSPQADRVRDIQPDDLLGREPVQLDEPGIGQVLRDQVVAVTGAGGSIGAELCEQVARFHPAAMVLIDASEFALYRVEMNLRERHPKMPLTALIVDVKDEPRLVEVLTKHRPSTVFHAAAYKHVPLVEVGNAHAALHNNALGTWAAARAAAACGVARFVLISTDKAVNPTNVMGATKRLAERAILHLARQSSGTRFMAVRFGNVLGSSGSVIPRFQSQIARGGPITVTHPEIIRYFMTISEACRLVLQAAAIGQTGQVLVLDMGEPVKIVDLARAMIRLSGHQPEDMPIVYTGLRPGEKLFEELLADSEQTVPTACESLRVARLSDTAERDGFERWLEEALAVPADDAQVRQHLSRWVPEYRPLGRDAGSGDGVATPP